MPATWTCPTCRRRVPLREALCFCGCPRERAEREVEEARLKDPAQPTRELGLTLALIALVLVFVVGRPGDPPRQAEPEAAPVHTLPPPPPPAPGPPPRYETPAPRPSRRPSLPAFDFPAASSPTPAPSAPATATPEPEPGPSASALRGREELRAGYAALAPEAARLEQVQRDYRASCLGSHVGVVVMNCDQMQAWQADSARRVREGIAAAEERARRARVLPGDVRALREQLGVERWEQLADGALAPR